MTGIREAGEAWRVELPPELADFVQTSHDACQLQDGEVVALPFPPLGFAEIIAAQAVAEDWDIPPGLVPIMGDFHDVVCLDYRASHVPAVVLLDDSRQERELFASFTGFFEALCVAPERTGPKPRIIEGESWLDF